MTRVNVDGAIARFDNDREIYLDLLETFLGVGAPDFPALSKLLAAGNADQVRKQVHKLKGGALTVGADDLAAAAGAFESAVIALSTDELPALLDAVALISEESFRELESIKAEFHTQP
jgi:HPt (histidine-containing phosphotransfer) domain-containing protein